MPVQVPPSSGELLSCIVSSQALKYAFQTHDRLCFVMEYANGGEVSGGPWPTQMYMRVRMCMRVSATAPLLPVKQIVQVIACPRSQVGRLGPVK